MRSPSRIISTSFRAAANPARTASPLPFPVWAMSDTLRSGWASICRSISARVPSLDPPSTKISSVPFPISGNRSIAALTFPASFRQGQTTETDSSSAGRGSGRATIQ